MKNLILFILIGFCFTLAETITLTENCYAKDGSNWRESKRKHKLLKQGRVIEVIAKYGDYYEVEIIKGKDKKNTSDNVGKTGYMWSHRVDSVNLCVTIEGVWLRTKPIKRQDTEICGVKEGAAIKIIRLLTTWYLTNEGWISATHAK